MGAIAHPLTALAAAAGLIVLAAPGLARLALHTDGHSLVPAHHPTVLRDAEIRAHFGLRDPIAVVVETSRPEGIFHPETLRRVRQLSERLGELEGVGRENVMSLATERRNRAYPGSLIPLTFLEPLPDTPELMEQLRSDIDDAGILTGTLVSADRRAVNILIGAPAAGQDGFGGDRIGLCRRIASLAASFATSTERISVVGAPVAASLLGVHILDDLALLLPVTVLAISLVLWAGCRRLWGVGIGLLSVGACLISTFGLMGWSGVPVYLTTAVLPVVLTTVGLGSLVHILWRYQRALAAGEEHLGAVTGTLERVGRPVVLASLTTAVGMVSFLDSPLVPVKAFGLFATAGVLASLFWALTAVPALIVLLGPERLGRIQSQGARTAPAAGARRTTLVDHWASALLAGRRPALATLLGATVLLGLGTCRLRVQDSWLAGFASESPLRQATERFNRRSHGSHLLLVHLTFDPPAARIPEDSFGNRGPLLDPAALATVAELESYIAGLPGVGGVLGPAAHLDAIATLWPDGERGEGTPRTVDGIARRIKRFDLSRGARRRREVIDDELRRAVVTVFLKDPDFRQVAGLQEAIRRFAGERLPAVSGRLDFAGDVAVSQIMISAIVRTQVGSLSLALACSLLLIAVPFRSLAAALLALVPSSIGALWTFGAMGWLGVPLGVASSMFCSVTLGIGVDYAIHLLESYRFARAEGHASPALTALIESSPAIVADTAAIAAGFSLLGLSQVPANARLGLLVACCLVASCLLTLAGLGPLLARPTLRHLVPVSRAPGTGAAGPGSVAGGPAA